MVFSGQVDRADSVDPVPVLSQKLPDTLVRKSSTYCLHRWPVLPLIAHLLPSDRQDQFAAQLRFDDHLRLNHG
jgi:hypothetical protein